MVYSNKLREGQNPQTWVGDPAEDGGQELRLPVPELFSFTEALRYLNREPNECMHAIKGDRIVKALRIGEEAAVVEVREEPSALAVRFLGEAPAERWVRAEAARYVRDWFDLDTDLRPFYELASADPLLSQAIRAHRGLRCIGIPDLFEAVSWGILGQQITLSFAYTLKRRLVEAYGVPVEAEGQQYWLFPTVERIASLSVSELTDLRMTGKKAEYLIEVATRILDGRLSKEGLLDAGGCREAEKQLVAIRGIGPWTANYVLMRCLRMATAFPIDDVGLHNAIKFAAGMDRKPTKDELKRLAVPWAGWEAYATFYLWRLLY
ncbi:DNA-3-methyladenine glycosylase [Paenibacillus sp. J31TS4]|uniref:DNA-3-methyladenine glycosylase family protein n=1 Tax=Paenibacillus sp. J31TS4 TaxID=2807195 RepID=UPI001B2E36FC|nr:DNA-3-methyladenine glycosylase [Paenibacillus sp. J31TS4]GIP38538.1 DNA-3-methyladenine glycosylase [Paenibacillus sp. J31TS4]